MVDWDFSGFKLTLADEAAYKSMAPGASMTLISNATGLEGVTAGRSQVFDYTVAKGAKLNTYVGGAVYLGKNHDTDSAHANKVTYDIESVRITSVNLAGWDSTKEAFAVPETWVPRGDNICHPYDNILVPVTAAGFTAPTISAGTSQNIITTNTADFFSDDKITGALKYAPQASSSATDKGVTFTGSESKGVKASDDGKNLIYARSNFNVNNIAFGTMAWGTPRDASAAGYDYSNAAVNMDGLTFSNPESIVANTSTTLLTANNNRNSQGYFLWLQPCGRGDSQRYGKRQL